MMKYLPNIKSTGQYIAVQAELDEAKKKAPGSSNKQWLVAKRKRAIGALQEAETADQERYIVWDMSK
jgi:HlyD family secretion protein